MLPRDIIVPFYYEEPSISFFLFSRDPEYFTIIYFFILVAIRPLLSWLSFVYMIESICTKFELLNEKYAVQLLDIKQFDSAGKLTDGK